MTYPPFLLCFPVLSTCLSFLYKVFASHPARAWHSWMSCPSVLPLMQHLSTCMLAWRQSIPPAFPACFNIGYLSVSLSCLSFLTANHAWLLSTCLVNSPSVLLSHACSAVHLACMPNVIPFLLTYPNFSPSFYIPIQFFCSACLLSLPLSCDLFVIHLFLCHLFLAFPYLYCLWRHLLYIKFF